MTTQDGRVKLPTVRNAQLKPAGETQSAYIKGLEEEAQAATLRRRVAAEQQAEQALINPPAQDPPVKVTGEISMGRFDFQEQQERARQAEADARKESEQRTEALRLALDKRTEELHDAKLNAMELSFASQVKQLTEALQRGQQNQPSFEAMLSQTEAMAEKLGFTKSNPAAEDWNGKMAFVRLEGEMKRENMKLEQLFEKDRREWQVELAKLTMEKEDRAEKRKQDEQRMQMFANLPNAIGAAMAKGILARGAGAAPPPVGALQGQPETQEQPGPPQPINVDAPEGIWSEFDCAACHSLVGVGPTALQTNCASCGYPYNIVRHSSNNEGTPEETHRFV